MAICDITKFAVPPSADAYSEAFKHKVVSYESVPQTLEHIVSCLCEGYPITFGFQVYESFESEEIAETGIVRMPDTVNERLLGGHCVDIVGYNKEKGFLVRNSWGKEWGIKNSLEMHLGHAWFPKKFILNPELCSEFYVLKKIVNLD
ncbi:MAG: hypothetical protein HRK26_02755 [Rickettsiaceae bacterium H1]|nr:hypothetical protein [Rickettsiaceae bacterium H1]